MLLLLYIVASYLTIFPSPVSPNIAVEILKAILQVNGFLIGFIGVIFAQLLRGLYSQQAAIQQERFKLVTETVSPKPDKHLDLIDKIKDARRSVAVFAILDIICFLISILYSLAQIAWIWEEGPPVAITFLVGGPLLYLITGIMFLFYTIIYVEFRPL